MSDKFKRKHCQSVTTVM